MTTSVLILKIYDIFATKCIKSIMTSSIKKECFPSFGLINTFVLVNPDILLEREREREREKQASRTYNNIAPARQDTHFSFSKNFSLALFFREYFFDILSCYKVSKQKVVRIPLMAKRVLSYSKKTFSKYKFKRFLSGIDYYQIDTFYINISKVYIV